MRRRIAVSLERRPFGKGRAHPFRSTRSTLLALAAAASVVATAAHAQDVTLEPAGRGIIRGDDSHVSSYTDLGLLNSFVTGTTGGAPSQKTRAFFVFDLPMAPVSMHVVAADLRLCVSSLDGVVGGIQRVTVTDVDSSVGALEDGTTATFDDLGDGDPFGSRLYSDADEGTCPEITLDADAINLINGALGGQFAFSLRNSEEEAAGDHFVFGGSGSFGNVEDGQSQLLLTWGPDTVAPPSIVIDAPAKISPDQAPVCFTVDATSAAGIDDLLIEVIPVAVSGSGNLVDKSNSAVWDVAGDEVCILDSGGVGTLFLVFALAVDGNDAANVEEAVVEVVRKRDL